MKLQKSLIAAALMVAVLLPTMTAAKKSQAPQRVYMFGFAASFNDTIVHFTDIQAVDSVMLDSKTNFLQARSLYASMLGNYLTEQQMPYRTCVIFYDRKINKLQKKYLKMKKLYGGNKKAANRNDIREITASDFRFTTIKLEPEGETKADASGE